VGRVYFNTDIKSMEYDTGSAWSSQADAKARATILWHTPSIPVASGQNLEVPFDNIIDDPGGYASTQYHQIIMPQNSIGIVTAFVQLDQAPGGFGATLSIEQWDAGGTGWHTVATMYNNATQFFNCTTMVDSRWGLDLRVMFLNASTDARNILCMALGASPRFGFVMVGRTS